MEATAPAAVRLTVINEFVATVTAYRTGRIRLGDVGQNRTRLFMTPRRGNSVAVATRSSSVCPRRISSRCADSSPGSDAIRKDLHAPHRSLLVLLALAATACASSAPSDGGGADDTVQLTVVNEYQGTVTTYAVWGSGRIRLGDVGQNRTRLFMTPRRSDRVAIGLELIGAPPAGTSAGPTPRLSPYRVSESIPVVEGDAVEFRLSAANVLTVRRLEAGL